MKPVLFLQHDSEDPPGFLGELLQEHAIAFEICDVTRSKQLPTLGNYSAVVALGGAQQAYDEVSYPYFVEEKAWLRELVAREIPYLGLCLGGQLLASALGAEVRQHTQAEIGFFTIPLTEAGRQDPLFEGLPDFGRVFHWHMDVFDLPSKGKLLASNACAPHQAFRYGQHAYGLQYHIEVTPAILASWMRSLEPETPTEIRDHLAAIQRDPGAYFPAYHAHSRQLFRNFLRLSDLA
ncbi:glutamine amidotransferase [Ktedonobacter sp. SOSP1-52]|uniref:type 1 glutamine amidotransferase n=1 Tax=Ktedonobacter sp. SOSP1-52 TaxID=2778366 RepID=UPI00191554CF|nr:type 1 glutamine amidotransferase [Ktedonobacter sp. SOSP1-52]GHO64913.1 glutamine amidotransferase [Ktedonobacter sp. SOSP1-52]